MFAKEKIMKDEQYLKKETSLILVMFDFYIILYFK